MAGPEPSAGEGVAIKRSAPAATQVETRDLLLYALVLFCWGTGWLPIHFQLGVVAPEVTLFYRIGISAILLFAWLYLSGRLQRFPIRDHLTFLMLGVCLFGVNYLSVYYAGGYLATGVIAVVFSTASVMNLALSALVARILPPLRVAAGALIGIIGIALVFSREFADAASRDDVLIGLLLALFATFSFSCGNMLSARAQSRSLPVLNTNAYGMLYSTVLMFILALTTGKPFNWDPDPLYAVALGWHVVFSTVVAFAAYLTLVGRIGPGRAGYATVVFPVIALLLSALFEGYQFHAIAFVGLLCVMIGNVLVLGGRRRIHVPPPARS